MLRDQGATLNPREIEASRDRSPHERDSEEEEGRLTAEGDGSIEVTGREAEPREE